MGAVTKSVQNIVGDVVKDVGDVIGKPAKAAEIIPTELTKAIGGITGAKSDIESLLKSMDGFTKEIDSLQATVDKLMSGLDGASKAIDKAEFGLDPKKPEHKKAIADARKTLLAAVDKLRDQIDDKLKPLAGLQKTVASVAKSGLA